MDAAAGLSRPPELSLLRTARDGRAVSTSVALALPHVAGEALPAAPADRALLSPAATLDPSVAAALAANAGAASEWDFVLGPADTPATVTLADLALTPADALALTRSELERLATEAADGIDGEVVGGSAGGRYERAADLVGLIGRRPALRRTFSEARAAHPPGDPVDPDLVARYGRTREVAVALAGELRAQVGLSEPLTRRHSAGCSPPAPPGVSPPIRAGRPGRRAWPRSRGSRSRSSMRASPRRPMEPPPRSCHRPPSSTPRPRSSAPPASSG